MSTQPSYGYIYQDSGIKFVKTENIIENGEIDDRTDFINDEANEYLKRSILNEDDILFSIAGTIGRVGVVRKNDLPANTNQALAIIRCPWKTIENKYLFYYLKSPVIQKHAVNQVVGVGRANLSLTNIKEFPLYLAPLPEQKRIVAEIEKQFTRLDQAVASLKRAQANLQRYKASVLKAACEGSLVPQDPDDETAEILLQRILAERRRQWQEQEWAKHIQKAQKKVAQSRRNAQNRPARLSDLEPQEWVDVAEEDYARYLPKNDKWKEKYKEPEGVDTAELPPLPDDWAWASMPLLGELNRGKSKHRPRNDPRLFGGPYPFIQTGEVRQSEGYVTDYSQTYSEYGLAQSRLWPSGTLAITIAANIAETAILSFEACFPDSVVGFILENESCDVRFIEYFIRTAKSRLEEFAPATAQKNINLRTLSELSIPLPPLREQRRIADELDRQFSIILAQEDTIAADLVRAERLRQSILQQAFSGRLVPNETPV